MGIYDRYSSFATATYDLDDSTHVEFRLVEYPIRPEHGEYRLLTKDNKDIAVGMQERCQEDFLLGDENLYNLYKEWEKFEDYDTEEDAAEDGVKKPQVPKPRRYSSVGFFQGDEMFVYIPADSDQTEEDDEYSTRLLANYVWGGIYVIEVTFPDGTVKISEDIEYADDENDISMFALGYGNNKDIAKLVAEIEWREDI